VRESRGARRVGRSGFLIANALIANRELVQAAEALCDCLESNLDYIEWDLGPPAMPIYINQAVFDYLCGEDNPDFPQEEWDELMWFCEEGIECEEPQ
jgi:hypothetical protein